MYTLYDFVSEKRNLINVREAFYLSIKIMPRLRFTKFNLNYNKHIVILPLFCFLRLIKRSSPCIFDTSLARYDSIKKKKYQFDRALHIVSENDILKQYFFFNPRTLKQQNTRMCQQNCLPRPQSRFPWIPKSNLTTVCNEMVEKHLEQYSRVKNIQKYMYVHSPSLSCR